MLKEVANSICSTKDRAQHQRPSKRNIPFIKAGDAPKSRQLAAVGQPEKTTLVSRHHHNNHTETLRPDAILWSETTSQLVTLDLTEPLGGPMEEAAERKAAKYSELVDDWSRPGWRLAFCSCLQSFCWPILLQGFLPLIGWPETRRQAIKHSTEAAEKASRWLWLRRSVLRSSATQTQDRV